MTFYDIKIKNDSKAFDADEFYILAKGIDPNHSSDDTYQFIESYLQFDAQGQGSFVAAQQGMSPSSHFSKLLSTFPQDGDGNYVLSIPKTTGGRIYLSIEETVTLTVTVGYDSQQNPVSLTLAEPDPYKKDDPSFPIIYDKIEYTYNDDGVWIDTTAVDFFCMPLMLSMPSFGTVGLAQTRAAVIDCVSADCTGEWAKCKVEYAGSVLRIVAPHKAIGRPVGAENFDEHYLDQYINAVWKYYETNQIKVDCSEMKKDERLASGHTLFTGSVVNNGATFRFSNDQGYVIDVNKPSSNQVFGCDGGSMTAIPNTAESIIVRELGSALNVGLLPLAGSPTLNKAYFTSNKGAFYENSPQLPPDMQKTGPWYNLYSKALHSFGDKVYAFAFDDAVGEDSTLHTTDPVSDPATLTISDMTGTVLPSADDSTIYSVTFNLPGSASGEFDGTLLSPGPNDFGNVKSPLTVTFNGKQYSINIRLGAATPPIIGLVVSPPDDNEHVSISFPG